MGDRTWIDPRPRDRHVVQARHIGTNTIAGTGAIILTIPGVGEVLIPLPAAEDEAGREALLALSAHARTAVEQPASRRTEI